MAAMSLDDPGPNRLPDSHPRLALSLCSHHCASNIQHTMADETSDALTNDTIPRSRATLTIRVVKSFEFRTEKSLILKNVNCETTTVGQLKEMARQGTHDCGVFKALLNDIAAVQTQPGWKPYRNATLGTPVPFS